MTEAFAWWIAGCLTTWTLMRLWHIRPIDAYQKEANIRVLSVTYNVFVTLRDRVFDLYGTLVENKVFTEEEATAMVAVELAALHRWGDEMIEIQKQTCKDGKYPYVIDFKNWEQALQIITKTTNEPKD